MHHEIISPQITEGLILAKEHEDYMNKNRNRKINYIITDDCNYKCQRIAEILYGDDSSDENDNIYYREDKYSDELDMYEAYKLCKSGNYGHINYALLAFIVKKGHLNCLKKIHKNNNIQWHNDLADLAIEVGNLEILKYIIQEMGDITI